ncbi:hypothetical protein [Oscillatoria sp. HE19RPO]|uniref:hypothetical protein n=1 Tax=Oscillatoria sp. HE19RPO TaxID=2954806 RepID=UPI0020C35A15|nr:hypothetical protein [Oscillatoria sp. HE19RPO]
MPALSIGTVLDSRDNPTGFFKKSLLEKQQIGCRNPVVFPLLGALGHRYRIEMQKQEVALFS